MPISGEKLAEKIHSLGSDLVFDISLDVNTDVLAVTRLTENKVYFYQLHRGDNQQA